MATVGELQSGIESVLEPVKSQDLTEPTHREFLWFNLHSSAAVPVRGLEVVRTRREDLSTRSRRPTRAGIRGPDTSRVG